jgi:predicted acetylornithine/succinylornithine family transaminase
MNTYARIPLSFPKGKGVYLYDQNDEKYLDLMSGIGVNALGYNHPKIVEAMQNAMQKPTHLSNLYEIPEQNILAEKLIEHPPFDQAFFCNSGTEANEAAIKLVRKFHKDTPSKTHIVSFSSSFHGRTMGSLAITGKDSIKTGFTPLIGDTHILPWNDEIELENFLEKNGEISGKNIAGIFLEPIQGEGGINLPSEKFLEKIDQLCKKYNILLVADEVQTGIGRTGKKYAFEHFNLNPDIICLAKGLGGGMPIGAILAKKEVAKAFTPSTHGTTFGGNPFVCTVAKAVVDEVFQENFLEKVEQTGKYIEEEIKILQKKFPEILLEFRGKGLMVGIEINTTENRNLLVEKFLAKKILVLSAGEKTLRLLPPLIITPKEIQIFLDTFKIVLQETKK